MEAEAKAQVRGEGCTVRVAGPQELQWGERDGWTRCIAGRNNRICSRVRRGGGERRQSIIPRLGPSDRRMEESFSKMGRLWRGQVGGRGMTGVPL